MRRRYDVPYQACWYRLVTRKAVRENPGQFKAEHIGRYFIRECVDLFDQGEIVTEADIKRQLEVFRTGRLSAAHSII